MRLGKYCCRDVYSTVPAGSTLTIGYPPGGRRMRAERARSQGF